MEAQAKAQEDAAWKDRWPENILVESWNQGVYGAIRKELEWVECRSAWMNVWMCLMTQVAKQWAFVLVSVFGAHLQIKFGLETKGFN